MTKFSKQLAAILAKIGDNNIEAWRDRLDYTVPVVILDDFDRNDPNSGEEINPDLEYKYNGWLEELQALQKEVKKSEQKEPKKPIRFFLFGEYISKLCLNDSFNAVVKHAKEGGDFETAVFDPNTDDVSSLLLEFEGWGGFAEISEREYKRLRKIKD